MEFPLYQNQISHLTVRLNLMVALVFGLLVSNVLLASLVWVLHVYHAKATPVEKISFQQSVLSGTFSLNS